ncbi:SufI protein [Escherichia coli]|uniref:SufI protein n=1 Tax=Escherichia coli TaxID=562 RepID=A0A376VWJ5_ECOLX|nr:SufI protein [Escherichia coli]
MSLSRRQFIQASGIALCAGAVPLKASAAGQQQPLPVPPLLESRRGQPLFMTVQRAHWSFTPGTRASGLGNQWSLPGADYPRLEGRRC